MNQHKGETQFTSNGQDYILKFNMNALCELEDGLGLSIHKILEKFSTDVDNPEKDIDISLTDIRTMMRCGLNHSADSSIDDKKAGEIIDGLDIVYDALDLVGKALIAALAQEDADAKKKQGEPEANLA